MFSKRLSRSLGPVKLFQIENFTKVSKAQSSTTLKELSIEDQIKSFDEIPGPPRVPLLGHLYLYKLGIYKVDEYHHVIRDLYQKYGSVVREQIGTKAIIHLFDPKDVHTVHSVEGKTPMVPPLQETAQLYRQKRELSLGLGNTNGEEWYRLRSAVQQMMMRPKEVHHYLHFTDEVAQDFVRNIESSLDFNNVVPDLRLLVAKWSLESSGMICFEKRLGCFDKNEELAEKLIQANKDIFYLSGILKFSLPIFKYISTPKWRKFLEAEDFFFSTTKKIFDETISEIQTRMEDGTLNENQFNFLSYLLSRKDMSLKDVNIITFSLFADGLSTTTPSLMYNLYCLAKNQGVQEKVYQELTRVIPSPQAKLTVEVLNKLQLLKAAVKETFRLYPIGTEVSRTTQTDLVLGNYRVPSGTHVDMNQFVHFRSSAYFQDPDSFIPERWFRDSSGPSPSSGTGNPFLLTPFGHGTRMCAGRRFAEQDLYTSLTRILQSFQLKLVNPEEKMEQVYHTLLFPRHPLRIRFIPRETSSSSPSP